MKTRTSWRVTGVSLALLAFGMVPAQAGTVLFGNGWTLDYLADLTYSAAVRTEHQDSALVGNINGDDGDRNFDDGSLITNRLALLGELRIEKGRYGIFLRGSAFYDRVYADDESDNTTPNRLNYTDAGGFTDAAVNRLGKRVRLLDAYVYGAWAIAGTSVSVRAGNQVVSWGQSLFFPNMAGLMAPSDATKSNIPGTSVKQILLPTEQIYVQWGVTNRINLDAFYQFDYDQTELSPVGSYFSTTDVVGPGSQFIRLPPKAVFAFRNGLIPNVPAMPNFPAKIPKGEAIKADSDSQWGVRATYRIGLGTLVGLHYLHMHAKNPTGVVLENGSVAGLAARQASYHPFYASDIDMYALSLATGVAGVAVGAELSYRQGAGVSVAVPALLGSAFPTPTTADVWQANVNATQVIGPSAFWDRLVLIGGLAGTSVEAIDPLVYNGQAYDELGDAYTEQAAAFQGSVIVTYQEVFDGWDLSVSLSHANAFYGTTAVVATLGSLSGEGDRRYNLTWSFDYLDNLTLAAGYNYFIGDPDSGVNDLADRSFATFSAKYSF